MKVLRLVTIVPFALPLVTGISLAAVGVSAEVFRLVADYTFETGEVHNVHQLGIGTYDEQVKRASAKTSRPIRILPPRDHIKRGNDKTIYGDEDLRDVYAVVDPKAKLNAEGVASISEFLESRVRARGLCTAFLISKDRAMTASHCINGNDFRDKVIRFNDQYVGEGLPGEVDSYEIETVELWDKNYDLAILKMKPNSTGVLPGEKYHVLKLKNAPVRRGTKLYIVGHPGRDYKKFADNCSMIREYYFHAEGKHTFGCDCDAFGGMSGSPVFQADTHQVVGVFWGGQLDDRRIRMADQITHEFVVPMWKIAVSTKFSYGTWPSEISFEAMLRGGYKYLALLLPPLSRQFE